MREAMGNHVAFVIHAMGPYTREDLIQPAHINASLAANGRGTGLNPYGNGTEKGKEGIIRKTKS